jgi:hypothetical protein
VRQHRAVIRNVCIHISNEQPLLADLFDVPTAADAGLVCTNVRMLDGKRPVFIDDEESTFFFPYLVVRFVEIPPGELRRHRAQAGSGPASAGASAGTLADADAAGGAVDDERLPVPVAVTDDDVHGGELDLDLEIDEGFLQRIRDI